MTSDLKMGGNRITNVAAATTSTDAARFDQVEGKIAGPASATADAVPVFNGTTGKLIKDSVKLLPTGDIVGTTDAQTLPNKTLISPLINVGSDAAGDLLQRNAAGTGFDRIPVGVAGTALVSDGTKWASGDLPSWTETTPVATTSGTAIDVTSIPAGVTDIEVWLDGVSGNSNGDLLLQIGTGGTPTTTGYVSAVSITTTSRSSTAGMITFLNSAGNFLHGSIKLKRFSGNIWISQTVGTTQSLGYTGGGRVALAGELDNLRLTLTAGSFDAGEMRLRYM
jgi:hypothetical protein|tara:strand:+ start:18880 stop:19719 length:840 start_codon:yes stop_codon:yes gene_type:complete